MPSKASLAVLDSASTPVAGTPASATRTFIPGEVENNVHAFYEPTTGTNAATRTKFTASVSPGNGVHRIKYALALPKAVTADGLTKAAHVNRAFVEFIVHEDSTWDDRADLRALIANLLDKDEIKTMVQEVESFY